MRERIQAWMRSVVDAERYAAFDDLHIDQVDAALVTPEHWLSGAVQVLQVAEGIRENDGFPVTVAVGISLESGPVRTGIGFDSLTEAERHFGSTPPSLYVFKRGEEPWSQGSDCGELGTAYRPDTNPDVQVYYCEWFDKNDSEFRRSLWLAK